MKPPMLIACVCMLLCGAPRDSWGARDLTDDELDQITAGVLSVGMVDGKLNFQLGGDQGSGVSVTGSGTVAATSGSTPSGPAGYIIMRDNAQSNLHAFVNVNAVNSNVQVLINLTVNINSTVGTINQTNTVPAF